MKTSHAALSLLLIAVTLSVAAAGGFNITEELQKEPTYSEFNDILTKSGLASEVNSRNSITVAVLPNPQIDQLRASLGPLATDKQLADIVRTHILLTFIDPDTIKKSGTGDQQITSLYQTTGKAPGEAGVANLTTTKTGQLDLVMTGSNTTITKSVKEIGYNLSIVEVDRALTPLGVLPIAPAPAPPPGAPVPAPAPVAPAPAVAPAPVGESPKATSPSKSANSDSGAFSVHGLRLGSVMATSALGLLVAFFCW